MNKDNAAQYLPLVQAMAEGKTIQMRHSSRHLWQDISDLDLSYPHDHYRVKPEPREYWLARDSKNGEFLVFDKIPTARWNEVIHVREVVEE